MKKRRTTKLDQTVAKTKRAAPATKRRASPTDYGQVLADMKRLIADSRHRALATVNRELVCLYWHIGRVIVQQQEAANWGDAVVEQLATDLHAEFPDMVGLTSDNLWRMRKFFWSCREIGSWLADAEPSAQSRASQVRNRKLGTACPQLLAGENTSATTPKGDSSSERRILGTLSPQMENIELQTLVAGLSWSHHRMILGTSDRPDERYFYMAMSARERWSVRELRRQIDSGLFLRYMSVKRDPEKCLPAEAESGDLLPFKDHYILEFLGLSEEHSEKQLRKAILANLRDFFLEFGRDLTFVGEEYPLTVGNSAVHTRPMMNSNIGLVLCKSDARVPNLRRTTPPPIARDTAEGREI